MVARQGTQSIERPRTYPSQNLTVNAASIFFLLSSIMEARSRGYLSARDNKCHTSKMCDQSAGSRELLVRVVRVQCEMVAHSNG